MEPNIASESKTKEGLYLLPCGCINCTRGVASPSPELGQRCNVCRKLDCEVHGYCQRLDC